LVIDIATCSLYTLHSIDYKLQLIA